MDARYRVEATDHGRAWIVIARTVAIAVDVDTETTRTTATPTRS